MLPYPIKDGAINKCLTNKKYHKVFLHVKKATKTIDLLILKIDDFLICGTTVCGYINRDFLPASQDAGNRIGL
jgi:hypothetical protein